MPEPKESERTFPATWRMRYLFDLTERISQRNRSNNTNVLTISAQRGLIDQEEYFSRRVASQNTAAYFLLRRGDFAYNKSYSAGYPVGVVRRLDRYPSGIVSPLYICFRLRSPEVDTNFLQHYFQAGMADDHLAGIAKEGIRNHGLLNVAIDDFFKIAVTLPPIREQRRIADILDTLEESIRSTQCLVAKLEAIKRGAAVQMMATIQARSNSACLGELGHIASGATPSRRLASRYFTRIGLPWVKTLDLNEGTISHTEESLTPAAVRETSCPVLHPGTLLIAMYGGWAQIGRSAILGVEASINQAISAVLLDRSKVEPEYALRAVQYLRPNWQTVAASTRKDPNITRADVSKFEIPIPPHEEQRSLVATIKNFDSRVECERIALAKLRRLKQGLPKALFTGRARVTVN